MARLTEDLHDAGVKVSQLQSRLAHGEAAMTRVGHKLEEIAAGRSAPVSQKPADWEVGVMASLDVLASLLVDSESKLDHLEQEHRLEKQTALSKMAGDYEEKLAQQLAIAEELNGRVTASLSLN